MRQQQRHRLDWRPADVAAPTSCKTPFGGVYRVVANAFRDVACPDAHKLSRDEYTLFCSNWTGPCTDRQAALAYPNRTEIDACSETHDFERARAREIPDKQLRRAKVLQADVNLLRCAMNTKPFANFPYRQLAVLGMAAKICWEFITRGLPVHVWGTL